MSKFVLCAFSCALLFCGCRNNETVKAVAGNGQVAAVQAEAPAVVEDFIPNTGNYGTVTQCPVMGEKIVVDKDTKAYKYKGKIYYLCCPSCEAEFKQNPEKYAK